MIFFKYIQYFLRIWFFFKCNKYPVIFEMTNNSSLKDNELLFYNDNYVLVSKNNDEVKRMSDLKGVTIGVLETDLNKIKSSLNLVLLS